MLLNDRQIKSQLVLSKTFCLVLIQEVFYHTSYTSTSYDRATLELTCNDRIVWVMSHSWYKTQINEAPTYFTSWVSSSTFMLLSDSSCWVSLLDLNSAALVWRPPGSRRSCVARRAAESLFSQPPVAPISWQLLANKCLNEIINERCQTSTVSSIRAESRPSSSSEHRSHTPGQTGVLKLESHRVKCVLSSGSTDTQDSFSHF